MARASDRDLEMICDLLDGRLQGEARSAAFRRIDGDEALYEVFVETVRWRAAQRGESTQPARRAPPSPRRDD